MSARITKAELAAALSAAQAQLDAALRRISELEVMVGDKKAVGLDKPMTGDQRRAACRAFFAANPGAKYATDSQLRGYLQ